MILLTLRKVSILIDEKLYIKFQEVNSFWREVVLSSLLNLVRLIRDEKKIEIN